MPPCVLVQVVMSQQDRGPSLEMLAPPHGYCQHPPAGSAPPQQQQQLDDAPPLAHPNPPPLAPHHAAAPPAHHASAHPTQVVVPKLTSNGLKWMWTGDAQARQCLQYRGVLPILADPTIGNPDGAILEQAFKYAQSMGIIKKGDRVVVSQCPRQTGNDIMQEVRLGSGLGVSVRLGCG